jgi:tripeptidyl-peptidase-1
MIQPTTFFGLREFRSTISEIKPIPDSQLAGVEDIEEAAAVLGCTGSNITPTCLANLYSLQVLQTSQLD